MLFVAQLTLNDTIVIEQWIENVCNVAAMVCSDMDLVCR